MLYQYHSTDPVTLPANIHDFSIDDLSGDSPIRKSRMPSGQHDNVWDYEKALARRKPVNTNQDQHEDSIASCRELIEQVSPSGKSLRNHYRNACLDLLINQDSSQSPVTTRHDIGGVVQRADAYRGSMYPPTPVSTTAMQGTEEPTYALEAYMQTPAAYVMPQPMSLFNDANMYNGVSEQDQLTFLQVMNEMQAHGGTSEIDAFEDWLRG
jgi:hypothetical protein